MVASPIASGAARAAEEFGDAALILCDEVFERFDHDAAVIGGIRENDGLAIHREYRAV